MSHYFKKIHSKDEYSAVDGSLIIVKNVSGGPFEVDGDGRVLSNGLVAAIDAGCDICKKGIAEGKLRVIRESKPSGAKQKPKSEPKEDKANEPVIEVPVVVDIQETVALPEQDKSVQ